MPHSIAGRWTNYNMPELNGLEVARRMLEVRPDLPVILSTGFLSPEVEAAAHEIGIRRILTKPQVVRQFGDTIAEELGRSRRSGAG